MHSDYIYRGYRKARRNFSLKTYFLLLLWWILAAGQWAMVCLVKEIQDAFRDHYYISLVAFFLSIFIFALFLFIERLRYNAILSIIISFIIVELQILALFMLVSRSFWGEMLLYFAICVVAIFIFVIIGLIVPRQIDCTLHIALLFILAFLFLLITVFFLMHQLLVPEMWKDIKKHGFYLIQIPITITILLFVMYHAQTINGGRFAEMRLHDFCLGSLILFHDFLIIYWLTFYWQMMSGYVSPDDWTHLSTFWNQDRRVVRLDFDDYTESILSNNKAEENVVFISQHQPTSDQPKLGITLDFREDDVLRTPIPMSERSWRLKRLTKDIRKADYRQIATEEGPGIDYIN
ncbi:uncharacterized protein LOC133841631 isoform X3 [Drosophila sulfurigaster albostrigata]|uniref:uncharacterized protein LOC133841631 isoform X3 n=1 Tax=Drosophila sulfurigaster albostrigata TaxID=89887 RepID=UPI002D219F55|nr:uncharacterized protein LOC133841631 isoform X3 [Drosophila sulfurigaster albostrigata]